MVENETKKVRTIQQAARYFREIDKDTAITETALRRLVWEGKIPYQKIGKKYLIALENVEQFFYGTNTFGNNNS